MAAPLTWTPEQILECLGDKDDSEIHALSFSLNIEHSLGIDFRWTHTLPKERSATAAATNKIFPRFPPEVLHMVLLELDFISLAKLTMTSSHGKAVTEDFRPWKEVMRYASRIPPALASAGLVEVVSPKEVHRMLFDTKLCANCGAFGSLLYLLRCERVCMSCAELDYEYLLIEEERACKLLNLSMQQLAHLPRLRALSPRHYIDMLRVFPLEAKKGRMLNLGKAIAVALEVHGHRHGPVDWERVIPGGVSTVSLPAHPESIMERFRFALYFSPPQNPAMYVPAFGLPLPPVRRFPLHPGDFLRCSTGLLASVRLPHIQSDWWVESGIRCRGCQRTVMLHQNGYLPPGILERISPEEDRGSGFSVAWRARMKRTRSDMLNHVSHCYGGQQLLRRFCSSSSSNSSSSSSSEREHNLMQTHEWPELVGANIYGEPSFGRLEHRQPANDLPHLPAWLFNGTPTAW